MNKPPRTTFQPTQLTWKLLKGVTDDNSNKSQSDICNELILGAFRPQNDVLEAIFKKLAYSLEKSNFEDQFAMRMALADSVKELAKHPLDSCVDLQYIMKDFKTEWITYRYDFPFTMDRHENELMHKLNEVLMTLDPHFAGHTRELGVKADEIFKHWDELKGYSETYIFLSTIIKNSRNKYPLDVFDTFYSIKAIDISISKTRAVLLGDSFEPDVPLYRKVYALQNEIMTYYTDNAFAAIAPHSFFSDRSEIGRELYTDYLYKIKDCHFIKETPEEEVKAYYETLKEIMKKAEYVLAEEYEKKSAGEE